MSSRLLRLLWAAAGLAVLLGWIREPLLTRLLPRAKPLARLEPAAGAPWVAGGFRDNGAYPATTAGTLPAHIARVGSWLDTDDWQGRAETAWFVPARTVHVGVAGYPKHAQCALWAEFRLRDQSLVRVDCSLADPREQWSTWEISTPAGAAAVRIVAEDNATGGGGWLAFSHPFRAWPASVRTAVLHVQVYATVALALTLVWGPGLLWTPRRTPEELRGIVLLALGPLLLTALGLAVWLLAGTIRPQIAATAATTSLWFALGVSAARRGFALPGSPGFRRILAVSALVVVAAAAKATYSVGPEGELFRGLISRNLTVGDRLDSRYPYYVVQAAAHHLSPAAPVTEKMFYPWTFFSRGPLAGLAVTPLVLATNATPPLTPPDIPWSPYDREGFAAYRVAMLVLGSTVIVAAFLLLAAFTTETWAVIGAGLLALSPFGVHEVLFTWPKWLATTAAIASFLLAHRRRPFAAGLALGVGFLFHPLVLLWAPWLGLWTLLRASGGGVPVALSAGARIVAGTTLLVVPWMALGAWMPHLPDTPLAGQGGFIRYWVMADWQPATWSTWWRTRWMNFANTFIPLHAYLDPATTSHRHYGSAYEPSGKLVQFAQAWWISLPFALGVGLWLASFAALARGARTFALPIALFVVGPAFLLVAYWGMDPLGLMRECGHPFFVALVALTVLAAARHAPRLAAALAHPATPWLQLPETFLMLWLTTLLNPNPTGVQFGQLDPLSLALNLLALLAAALLLARARRASPASAPAVAAPAERAVL